MKIIPVDATKSPPQNCPYCNGQREWSDLSKKLAVCMFCGIETQVLKWEKIK